MESQRHIVVRRLAEALCAQVDSKDYTSEYLALYYGVVRLTRYMRDPRTLEFVKAPYVVCEEILKGGRPSLDCDDLSALLAALVLAVGGQCRLVTLAFRNTFYNGERQYSHVLCEALVPGTQSWLILDPVAAENTPAMRQRAVAAKVWPVA